jgi:hypothetical protein
LRGNSWKLADKQNYLRRIAKNTEKNSMKFSKIRSETKKSQKLEEVKSEKTDQNCSLFCSESSTSLKCL